MKQPVHQWSLAVDVVRYVGEAVALVVADSRYVAEDAAELVRVDYEPLPVVVDPLAACDKSAPLLHPACKTNEIRSASSPMAIPPRLRAGRRPGGAQGRFPAALLHADGVLRGRREYHPHDKSYDVTANFQGPFSTHPVMAKALRVPGSKLRLRIPPDSGGSFGIKLSVFP